jgi:cysteine-rich repeat protein
MSRSILRRSETATIAIPRVGASRARAQRSLLLASLLAAVGLFVLLSPALAMPPEPPGQEAGASRSGLSPGERRTLLDSPRVGSRLIEALDRQERVRVVIAFDVPDAPAQPGKGRFASPAARAALAAVRDEIERGFAPGEFRLGRRFQRINGLVGEIDARGALRLLRHPHLLGVDLEGTSRVQLAQTVPLVGAAGHHDYDVTGSGVTVAVLDTGVDRVHIDLASKVIQEECFCTGCCPNGSDRQSGAGAAADDHGHGTQVSGVIASAGIVSPKGIAPDASIVAVKIANASGGLKDGDQLAAYDWLLERGGVDIVNASFGGGRYDEYCDAGGSANALEATAVDQLVAGGTLFVASSGNDGFPDGIVTPACFQSSLAVGSTYDANVGSRTYRVCADATSAADQVPCFSNSSTILDLVAPGAMITTTQRGGGATTSSGTSLSAPVVAGCAALLRQADPQATPASLRAQLTTSPFHVRDPKSNHTFPRLHCSPELVRSATTKLSGGPVPAGTSFMLQDYDAVTRTIVTTDDGNGGLRFYKQDTANGTWPLDRVLTLPPGAHWQRTQYGGGTLLIGFPKDSAASPEQGAVELREWSAAGWLTNQVIRPTDPHPYQRFGMALSQSDDGQSALIYASNREDGSYAVIDGENYVFRRSASGWWEQEAKLICWDCAEGEYLTPGCYDGETAVLMRSNSAYVFRRVGSIWLPEERIEVFEDGYSDREATCDVDGNHLIVGAHTYDDGSGHPPGRVFFYDRDPEHGTWSRVAEFVGDELLPLNNAGVGFAPQIQGNLAAASNPTEDFFGIAGAVYLYERQEGVWKAVRKLHEDPKRQPWSNLPEHSNRNFGMRLGLGPGVLLIEDKSKYHSSNEQNVPTDVYVFELERCGDGELDLHLGEACDDGNGDSGDGCSASCQLEGNACNNGRDDDGDRVADAYDPGCFDDADSSERSADFCDDGIDNDGDGLVDSPYDPGCPRPTNLLEDPICDDGLDNNGDGKADWKGAGSMPRDPECTSAAHIREGSGRSRCGLGFELALLLPLWMALRSRRRV